MLEVPLFTQKTELETDEAILNHGCTRINTDCWRHIFTHPPREAGFIYKGLASVSIRVHPWLNGVVQVHPPVLLCGSGLTVREMSAKYETVSGGQCSSGVEQRTHKPLVGGSIPPTGTILKRNKIRINKGFLNFPASFFQFCAMRFNDGEWGALWQPLATAVRPYRMNPLFALLVPS